MNQVKIIFCLICTLFFQLTNAETLKELITQHGRDYVVANPGEIVKKLNDADILTLAQLMIRDAEGSEVPKILLPLAKNGNTRAISVLAQKYNVGINGIPLDKNQAKIWTTKLEDIFKLQSSDKESVVGPLCDIYKNKNGVLYNQEKEIRYCKIYYESGKVDGGYAYNLLKSNSPFYNPEKGLALYKKCINEGNSFCKWNFAWQGTLSVDIARISSAKQLFEYASADMEKNSPTALNNLGIFYEVGLGTPPNLPKAIELYEKAASSGRQYGFYNLLRTTFFNPGSWKDEPKNADEASTFLAFYDYFSDSNDRADSVPFKQWLFEKKRLPTNSSEFENFLKEKANKGDSAAACMLSSYLIKNHQAQESMKYALMGKKSGDRNIQEWCSREVDRINVSLILRGMNPLPPQDSNAATNNLQQENIRISQKTVSDITKRFKGVMDKSGMSGVTVDVQKCYDDALSRTNEQDLIRACMLYDKAAKALDLGFAQAMVARGSKDPGPANSYLMSKAYEARMKIYTDIAFKGYTPTQVRNYFGDYPSKLID